jgi:hypothetical protein
VVLLKNAKATFQAVSAAKRVRFTACSGTPHLTRRMARSGAHLGPKVDMVSGNSGHSPELGRVHAGAAPRHPIPDEEGRPAMPKANVNTASREQLVEAGVRAELADEILKLRRKEQITGPEALEQVPGVGPATLEQLKKALDFGDPARGGSGDARGQERERGGRGGEEPGPSAREAVRSAARAGAEAAETAGAGGVRVVRRAAGAVVELERAVAHRSAEGTAELGRALVDLTVAQTRQNLETLQALSEAVDWDRAVQAVDWDRVLQLQSEFWRVSLERAAQLTQRYLEVGQAVLAAAADTARDQAKRAA